jgi:hypothetical protein
MHKSANGLRKRGDASDEFVDMYSDFYIVMY